MRNVKVFPKSESLRTGAGLRRGFLDFFHGEGHRIVPSGSLVPANDPTLMFVNAGMAPFKDVFIGRAAAPASRATSAQKCIRISGKHNDLENVGVTARHHTFFEMLGNFSFGDYFKEQAIELAWKFVTETLGLPESHLVVTVFGGENGLAADDEAAALWKRIAGLKDERVLRCGVADNFWQMGETGPCGPCSEIHFFFGEGTPDVSAFGAEPDSAGAGWVELWNLVFMQFERDLAGNFAPLPAPCIDTGAGLERFAAVMQGVTSNYDTDLLRPILDAAAKLAGVRYRSSPSPEDVALRVIADHARTSAFLIAEGIFPDRDGRAYVLRRVMRRAIRHAQSLGLGPGFLAECAGVVVDQYGQAYPELVDRRALISDVVRQEEGRFHATLKRGLDLIETHAPASTPDAPSVAHSASGLPSLSGDVAFNLYDTFGFPLDLLEVIGRERGFAVDVAGFEAAMEAARQRSAGSKVGSAALAEGFALAERDLPPTRFVGYEREQASARVLALLDPNAEPQTRLAAGSTGYVVTDVTPYYAESGGQVGDTGTLSAPGVRATILDTQRPREGVVFHQVRVDEGSLESSHKVELTIDSPRRRAIRRHHSVTHLLHEALRAELGPQATQKGSYVGPARLRFDFSAATALSPEQLSRIERAVNAAIMANEAVTTDICDLEAAKAAGAVGLFEARYGAEVRVLTMGTSKELCGGTHVNFTGDIGSFRIVSESSLAAGVRRIEAVAGSAALAYAQDESGRLLRLGQLLKTSPDQLCERIERLLEEQRALQKTVQALKRQLVEGAAGASKTQIEAVGGVNLLAEVTPSTDIAVLRERIDKLKQQHAPAVVILGTRSADGKALLAIGVSKGLEDRISAKSLIQAAAPKIQGGGGGRTDFAQAGGSQAAGLEDALATAQSLARATLAP